MRGKVRSAVDGAGGGGEGPLEDTGLSLARITSFSDAVFAVAITLLVLSIDIPSIPERFADERLHRAIWALMPQFFAFILSFVIIGLFWISHHGLFSYVKRTDRRFVWLNLLFLMCIVFLPFPTSVVSRYGDTRTGTIFYAGAMALTSLAMAGLYLYAVRGKRLVAEDFDAKLGRHILLNYFNMAMIFLVSIGIAFINTSAAKYFWLLIWANSLVLERIRRRETSRPVE